MSLDEDIEQGLHLFVAMQRRNHRPGADLRTIRFDSGSAEIRPELVSNSPRIEVRLTLVREGEVLASGDEIHFVSESHVLVGNRLLETIPVGRTIVG